MSRKLVRTNTLTLRRIETPPKFADDLAAFAGGTVEHVETYVTGSGCTVIHAIETGTHGTLRHASIAHRTRYPTWEEITFMRTSLFRPDEDVMMVLPRKGLYVNVHPNCFHLWQMPFRWEYT